MFDDYFEVYLADTQDSKAIHHNIRYQVYCEEMGFEDKDLFEPFQESDDWDDEQSIHFIARMKGRDAWVGAVRVILKNEVRPLPVELHCSVNPPPKHAQSVEISRLCIVKEVRRRQYDGQPPAGSLYDLLDELPQPPNQSPFDKRHLNRSIIWGLLYAAALYCKHHRIEDWYFMTTLSLAKILSQKGMILEDLGEPCHHHGIRYPYRMNVEQILSIPLWKEDFLNGYTLYSSITENQKKAA